MVDSAALRAKIRDAGVRYNYLAEKLGLSGYGFQLKVDGKNEFRVSEVAKLCELLGITSLREKERIFFAQNGD